MFDLEAHGPDTFVGTGPKYPWGGLYGGQIVAQALRAAISSVDPAYQAHSIRAYFIRSGDHSEPVRYEVDRIRNGRSFVTRRVVARQATGAILNAECSFQRPESSIAIQSVVAPDVPPPDGLEETSFSRHFDRCFVPDDLVHQSQREGAGRVAAWIKVNHDLGELRNSGESFIDQCWLAFVSDDLASDTVRAAHREVVRDQRREDISAISLDHTVWFHRRTRADEWHLHDFSCHHLYGARGLAIGHVFTRDGVHVATVTQEVLLRDRRERPGRAGG